MTQSKVIPLTKGKFAIVDDEDFEHLSKYNWQLNGYYAVRQLPVSESPKGSQSRMHREIMNAPIGMEVDHINGDKLDNRKSNLRICTRQENQRNRRKSIKPSSSKYKGVKYDKRYKKYEAFLTINRKYIFLGTYKTEREAAIAYNLAVKDYFGEFSWLNSIDGVDKNA